MLKPIYSIVFVKKLCIFAGHKTIITKTFIMENLTRVQVSTNRLYQANKDFEDGLKTGKYVHPSDATSFNNSARNDYYRMVSYISECEEWLKEALKEEFLNKNTIKIVRFEREGKGIFKHEDSEIYQNYIAKRTYERHNNGNFPTPWDDRLEGDNYYNYLDLDKDYKEWFCAYKTIEQIQEWIMPDEIDYFVSKGFRLLLLKVSEYQIGEKQVLFTRESIIKQEDITSLFQTTNIK
jgi:hypothetical protein